MEALRRLLGAAPARRPPPAVESDQVYPLHMLDDTKSLREIVITWTLRFDDVIDADALHASLSKLLEIGDWRKLGGRLRFTGNGELELHAPRPFTTDRPAVSYSHQAHPMGIGEHPLAKTLPKATQEPSISQGPGCFREFAARKGAPETLDDFIYNDAPQLSLHVTSFSDATLVGLSWPHTLMDVMGQQALLQAWSLVLAGRDAEVPPLLGAEEDVACAAVDSSTAEPEEFKMASHQLRGWSMALFGFRFAWDMLWNQVVETRTICLPKTAVDELQREARQDLASDGDTEKVPFISEGDVLTAWAARAVGRSLPQPRPLTLLHAINTRFRLQSVVQSPGVYVQNMALGAFTFLTSEAATGPLGSIAWENRRHLAEQTAEGQILAYLRQLRSESKAGSDPALVCGDPAALLVPFTNWSRADLYNAVDFSPAVVRHGKAEGSGVVPPGSMVYHHSSAMQNSPMTRNVVVVLGKDHGDNCWITGILLPATWAKIEEELKRFN